jgi:hypothetical protein
MTMLRFAPVGRFHGQFAGKIVTEGLPAAAVGAIR